MLYVSQLETVPENAKLYNVYAMDVPNGKEILIGRLELDGKLIKSKWGDENLFIRHQTID